MLPRAVRSWATVARSAVAHFVEDDVPTLAAALAFYTGLAFAPLVLIVVGTAGMLSDDALAGVLAEMRHVLGPEAGEAIDLVLDSANAHPEGGWVARAVGIATLLLSAAAVFGHLQASLNRVWDVKVRPHHGVHGWLRKRVFSLGIVFALVFLLIVSLAVSTVLALLFHGVAGFVWKGVTALASLATFSVLFALLFKYVPDVRIPWRTVRVGAITTAALFLVGKEAIGAYLGRSAVGSAYGAAGTLLVLLVWVYYSALVLFFGAEVTQAQAECAGTWIVPSAHAKAAAPPAAEATPEHPPRAVGAAPPQPTPSHPIRADRHPRG